MPRIENLSVITSMSMLVVGLFSTHFTSDAGWVMLWGRNQFAFSSRTPCYLIAILFASFAFLYSIGYIPFNQVVVRWHFWLSLGSLIVCAAGAILSNLAERAATVPRLGVPGTALVFLFLASIPTFLLTQVLFAVELTRALLRMHHA